MRARRSGADARLNHLAASSIETGIENVLHSVPTAPRIRTEEGFDAF
jgi:hypothetical protein